MKFTPSLFLASLLLVACDSRSALSVSEATILSEACNALPTTEKRKLCEATLERLKGGRTDEASSKSAKSNSQVITFKDVPLGRPGVKAALTSLCKQDKSNEPSAYDKTDSCQFSNEPHLIWLSYGSLWHTLANIEIGEDGALHAVEIKESKAAMIGLVEVLREKYGTPKKTTSFVENGMGTKFEQEKHIWTDAQGNRITIESIYDKVDQGRIVIESAARVAARSAAEKMSKEAGKSNL